MYIDQFKLYNGTPEFIAKYGALKMKIDYSYTCQQINSTMYQCNLQLPCIKKIMMQITNLTKENSSILATRQYFMGNRVLIEKLHLEKALENENP